jgi:hypothetical protein
MSTGFPSVVLGAISIPSNLVPESSVIQLLHSRYPLEHKLVCRGSLVTFFFLIIVFGGDRSGCLIDGVFSVPRLWVGHRRGCYSILRHRHVIISDSEFEDSPIRLYKLVRPIDMIVQLRVPPGFVNLATKIYPRSRQHFLVLYLDAAIEVPLILRLCFHQPRLC